MLSPYIPPWRILTFIHMGLPKGLKMLSPYISAWRILTFKHMGLPGGLKMLNPYISVWRIHLRTGGKMNFNTSFPGHLGQLSRDLK